MCLFFFFCIVVWIIWLDVCSMWITGSAVVVARVTSKFIVRFDVWLQSHTNWHMLWYVIALGDALRTKPLTRNHLCALLYRNHLQTQSSKLQTHTHQIQFIQIYLPNAQWKWYWALRNETLISVMRSKAWIKFTMAIANYGGQPQFFLLTSNSLQVQRRMEYKLIVCNAVYCHLHHIKSLQCLYIILLLFCLFCWCTECVKYENRSSALCSTVVSTFRPCQPIHSDRISMEGQIVVYSIGFTLQCWFT